MSGIQQALYVPSHRSSLLLKQEVQRHLEILWNYLFIIFVLQSAWKPSNSSFMVFGFSEAKTEQLSVLSYAKPRMERKSEQLLVKVTDWCKTVTPVMLINLFLFLTSEHPIYFQSTSSKRRQILKTSFTLSLTFFFSAFPQISHLCLCCMLSQQLGTPVLGMSELLGF